jgi:DNA primase
MSIIETIKAKINVVDEIGLVVALQKSGKALKGLCPFHNERTPSFYVFAETQTWRCFGCNEGGDIFSFVEKLQGLEFREALQYLAEKAGVSLDDFSGQDPEQARETNAAKERLRKLNEDALLWFHQMLLRSKEAAEARAYVQSRGISADTVVTFSLGYAPEQWDGLSRFLLGRGYTERELVSGGLARDRDGGLGDSSSGIYDYFRHRLIFPIRDMRGRVIGFGGRAFGENQPKYLNSPQTLLFEKNSVLYALDMARETIKLAKQVIIVEGYVDAVIAHQHGTKQTVACIGSAITEKHIQQLKKLTRQVTLALDPDAAGASATDHGIHEALETFDRTIVPVPLAAANYVAGRHKSYEARGMILLEEQVDAEINVLELRGRGDPDEVIRANPSVWDYAVSHPTPLMDYLFKRRTADLNLREPADKTEAAKRLLPLIGIFPDRVKRDAYVRKLASMIRVDERSLSNDLQQVLREQKKASVIAQFSEPMGQQQVARRKVEEPQAGAGASLTASSGKQEKDSQAGAAGGVGGAEGKPRAALGLDKRKSNTVQWEDYLIGLLLHNPGLSQHVCGIIDDGDFSGTDTRELYHILNSIFQRGSSSLHKPLEQLVPSALLTTVVRVRERFESGTPLDGAGQVKSAVQCATRLKRAQLIQSNIELQYVLREAQNTGDVATVQQLQRQLLEIHQKLRTIDSATHLQG